MTSCERAVLDELPDVVQKRCRTCGEWWPDDAEFFNLVPDRRRPRSYLSSVCIACKGRGAGLEYCGPRPLGIADRWCLECHVRLGRDQRPEARYCSGRCRSRVYNRRRAYPSTAAGLI
jgi:hypothetical protein